VRQGQINDRGQWGRLADYVLIALSEDTKQKALDEALGPVDIYFSHTMAPAKHSMAANDTAVFS